MFPNTQVRGPSGARKASAPPVVHCIDVRVRILAALALSVVVATETRPIPLAGALLAAIAATIAARVSLEPLTHRLVSLNLFLLLLDACVAVSTPGVVLLSLGPAHVTREGIVYAGMITLKANTIVLFLTTLLGSIEAVDFGYALERLLVPQKLTRLLLFTVRYLDVLHREYGRLSQAVAVRGFRPRLDRHSLRTFGYLAGMLLVRALDRSERVHAAMKCRGFTGRFHPLEPATLHARDGAFAAGAILLAALLVRGRWW